MRWLFVGLVTLMLVNGCAALKRTESLPSPGRDVIMPGPEGESDYNW